MDYPEAHVLLKKPSAAHNILYSVEGGINERGYQNPAHIWKLYFTANTMTISFLLFLQKALKN